MVHPIEQAIVQNKIYEALSMLEAKDQSGQNAGIPADIWAQIESLKADPITANLQGKFDLNDEIK